MLALILTSLFAFLGGTAAMQAQTLPVAPSGVAIRRAPVVSASEQGNAAGHTGSAVVETTLLPSGKTADSVLVESSRSPFLDADALGTMQDIRFQAPETPLRVRLTVEFRPNDLPTMKCDEAVRQIRWFESAWPEKTATDTLLYRFSIGLFALARIQGQGARAALDSIDWFEAGFVQAIRECERRPQVGFLDTLRRHAR